MAVYGIAAVLIFAVSCIFAMLGLGGGMLYVPILQWLGFSVKEVAIPVGLLLNGLNTLFAFTHYARMGLVDFRGALPAAIAALAMAPFGALCVQFVPQRALLLLFAAAVMAAGLRSLLTQPPTGEKEWMTAKRRMLVGAGVGSGAGFIGGLLGIGGGFIIAPVLMEMGYPAKKAAATTAFIVTFASLSGFAGHAALIVINPWLLVATVASVVAGSRLGAWFMVSKARPEALKIVYGIVLLGVALKIVYGVLSSS